MFKHTLAVIFLGATIAGCASNNSNLRSGKSKAIRLDVPFYSNSSNQCGPAALASVLNYWKRDVTIDQLKSEVFVAKLDGTLPMDMRPAITRRGLNAKIIAGSFDEIRNEIRQGRPVIAYLNFGTQSHPIGHFLVVTGFNEDDQALYVHSSENQNKLVSYVRFNRGWKDTDHWMLITSSQTMEDQQISARLPVSSGTIFMTAQEYVQLGQAYEQQNMKQEASEQYHRALKQNKNYEPALMSLGNISFEKKDYKSAEKYYRQVLKHNPNHGGANNNLAMVYLEEGRNLRKAESLASKALATEYKSYAEDTLHKIALVGN